MPQVVINYSLNKLSCGVEDEEKARHHQWKTKIVSQGQENSEKRKKKLARTASFNAVLCVHAPRN